MRLSLREVGEDYKSGTKVLKSKGKEIASINITFRNKMEHLDNYDSPLFEERERSFGCPCGKTYMSYPALYTHVKNKHDGKVFSILIQAPGQLRKPTASARKKSQDNLAASKTTL